MCNNYGALPCRQKGIEKNNNTTIINYKSENGRRRAGDSPKSVFGKKLSFHGDRTGIVRVRPFPRRDFSGTFNKIFTARAVHIKRETTRSLVERRNFRRAYYS